MTTSIIITFCVLILLAYFFDISSAKTRIPTVILLLLMGWAIRQLTVFFSISIPDLTSILPVLGTVGLILIVLEGSLELELNKTKLPLVKKAAIVSFFPLIVSGLLLAWLFSFYGGYDYKQSLVNVLPFAIISSAIAIPSARNLNSYNREFITYESSLSDIVGVIIFNFVALNAVIDATAFLHFGWQLILILVVSFFASVGLSYLLGRIQHHIKFIPIMVMVILIYMVSKIYHLPSLLFILLFGVFLGNLDELKQNKWIAKLRPDDLNKEVHKFREIATEAAFVIRTFFFLVFGYLIETSELLNTDTLLWAGIVVAVIFITRAIQLKIAGLPLFPLLFIAPRGLISILLFLSISQADKIDLVNNSLIIQVIILTALIMMGGMMGVKKEIKP
ncbi:cation:proton antiporter [Sediminibacterium goheungense]|uniref:Sodium/proton antiporter (CPA1 family) n=1 Tax=Sediminibacterium goheungense TaxID=1086393 RepID=A0A4R6IZF4_9BACT|nr:cation:proton antiporter [Sediminibacterium goheungense]TDO28272.1 sodium/proton antiporter (CPA1 family) [Sediminibacterium goheungense]